MSFPFSLPSTCAFFQTVQLRFLMQGKYCLILASLRHILFQFFCLGRSKLQLCVIIFFVDARLTIGHPSSWRLGLTLILRHDEYLFLL